MFQWLSVWLFGGHARIRAGHGDATPSKAATETPRPGSGGVLPQQIQPVQVDYLPRHAVPQLPLGGRVAVTAMDASTARPPRRGGLRGAHWFTSARKPSSEHRSYDVSCQAMEISRLLCTRLCAEQRETYTRGFTRRAAKSIYRWGPRVIRIARKSKRSHARSGAAAIVKLVTRGPGRGGDGILHRLNGNTTVEGRPDPAERDWGPISRWWLVPTLASPVLPGPCVRPRRPGRRGDERGCLVVRRRPVHPGSARAPRRAQALHLS